MLNLLAPTDEGVPDRLVPRQALEGVLTFKGEAAGSVLDTPAVPGRLLLVPVRLLLRRPRESVKRDSGSFDGGGFGRDLICEHIGM